MMVEQQTTITNPVMGQFTTDNDLCIHLESLKSEHEFDTFIETIIYYVQMQGEEVETIVKHLNKKVIDAIKHEANFLNLLKINEKVISIV